MRQSERARISVHACPRAGRGHVERVWNSKAQRYAWHEVYPTHCSKGHELGPGVRHLTWRGCLCTPGQHGHTVVICLFKLSEDPQTRQAKYCNDVQYQTPCKFAA
ncbi:hypothetical protein ACPPVO_43625 [Dactylosporangium sp. McL0621]|uniref:hypothetical protein n=1 Tax=Dactylosporangium sp. McL0621 TaxID=3415678 RepID=UPI003CEB86FD